MAELKVYSTDWCGDCHNLKRFLASEQIPYMEINIEHDPAAAEELIARTGKRGIPYMVVGDTWIKGYPMDAAAFRRTLKDLGVA
jgi:mycoredoxin